MRKNVAGKLGGLFWLWRNRKTMFPILKYEIGTRYYSSKYNLIALEAKIKSLAAKHIDFPELLENEKITLGGVVPEYFHYVKSVRGISPYELMALCLLVRSCKCIFELGTYKGITTLHLANNVADKNATIHTLDLPQEMIKSGYQIGEYLQRNQAKREIVQLYADSATFDFRPYHGKLDFIFIDGDHSSAAVKRDTAHLLLCLKKGVLIWDDFEPVHHRETMLGILEALEENRSRITKARFYLLKGTKFLIMYL